MNSSDLSSYSLEELTEALRILKNYKVSLRQIGARAVLFDPKDPKPPHIRVEYAPGFEQTTVKAFTKASITKYFPEASLDDKTIFRESNHITGGIRVFYGDDIIDISFEKFKNTITFA